MFYDRKLFMRFQRYCKWQVFCPLIGSVKRGLTPPVPLLITVTSRETDPDPDQILRSAHRTLKTQHDCPTHTHLMPEHKPRVRMKVTVCERARGHWVEFISYSETAVIVMLSCWYDCTFAILCNIPVKPPHGRSATKTPLSIKPMIKTMMCETM